MSDTFQIYCENLKRYINVRGGETLLEIYERLADEIDVKPICAHVNNKTEGLSYSVFKPKKICFIDERTPSGQRVSVSTSGRSAWCWQRPSTTFIRRRSWLSSIPYRKAIIAS